MSNELTKERSEDQGKEHLEQVRALRAKIDELYLWISQIPKWIDFKYQPRFQSDEHRSANAKVEEWKKTLAQARHELSAQADPEEMGEVLIYKWEDEVKKIEIAEKFLRDENLIPHEDFRGTFPNP